MPASVKGEAAPDIQDIVRYLLEETHTIEPPTNAERIARFLGLTVRGFFHREHNLASNIRAYLLPSKSEIGVSRMSTPQRRKFSILHEVGHFVLPGHLDSLGQEEMLLDDSRSLSDFSVLTVEMEANKFAADCIFQLDTLHNDARSLDLMWANVSKMANRFDASLIATARRWVEGSTDDCALLVFKPVDLSSGIVLNYSYSIVSQSFRQKYFARLSAFSRGESSNAFRAYRDTRGYAGLVEPLAVDIGESRYEFEMSLFSTQYGVYGLISMPVD